MGTYFCVRYFSLIWAKLVASLCSFYIKTLIYSTGWGTSEKISFEWIEFRTEIIIMLAASLLVMVNWFCRRSAALEIPKCGHSYPSKFSYVTFMNAIFNGQVHCHMLIKIEQKLGECSIPMKISLPFRFSHPHFSAHEY